MNISNVIVSDNSLTMEVKLNGQPGPEILGPMCNIHLIRFQFKVLIHNSVNTWRLFLTFEKCVDDELFYTLTVNSTELNIKSKTFISDDSKWREIGCYNCTLEFNIEINVGLKNFPFVRLFNNNDLEDFELSGIDGSIRVHKTVLAAASEVFEKMITNDFKEKKDARVELPYSMSVLKDLKDYLYLNTINNDNLENLLMLANCYMMYTLKSGCIKKLFYNMVTEKDEKEEKLLNEQKECPTDENYKRKRRGGVEEEDLPDIYSRNIHGLLTYRPTYYKL